MAFPSQEEGEQNQKQNGAAQRKEKRTVFCPKEAMATDYGTLSLQCCR